MCLLIRLFTFSQIGCQLPMFLHLLRKNPDHKLTVKQLVHLLKPEFSPEGSNSRSLENDVYAAFVKYIREVASKYCILNLTFMRTSPQRKCVILLTPLKFVCGESTRKFDIFTKQEGAIGGIHDVIVYIFAALQAATILVAMASGKKFCRPKFWQKLPIGDQQIKRETYLKNYQ